MGGVEYGADDALRALRAHCPVGLGLCCSRVGVVAVHTWTDVVLGTGWELLSWPDIEAV